MNTQAWTLLGAYLLVTLLLAWPLGRWMTSVMEGRFHFGARLEAPLYRLAGVKADADMGWLQYALGVLVFNLLGVIAVYALQRLQGALPLQSAGAAGREPRLLVQHRLELRHQHQLAGLWR